MAQDKIPSFDRTQTITGFNFSFCKKLFTRTRQLELEGKLYSDRDVDTHILSTLGAACLNHLENQLLSSSSGHSAGESMSTDELYEFFSAMRQFLEIFESE